MNLCLHKFFCLSAALSGMLACMQPSRAIQLKPIADGMVSPTVLVPVPDGSHRLLIADQVGQIYLVNGEGQKSLFFDLAPRLTPKLLKGFDERGLLGLALHPKFPANGRLFVMYSAPLRPSAPGTNWDNTLQLSEFRVQTKGGDLKVDGNSEKVLLEIDKPYFNHNGGAIAFGPDGYLYISVGDGGNANDEGVGHSPQGNGQDTNVLLGKMLRIDVDHPAKEKAYGIPRDNPFVKGGGRPEIFAYGLRNSWRMSFDRGGKHQLYAGEIGQDLFEEVNIIVKGGNYGWNVREGLHCFDPKNPTKSPEQCAEKGADGKPFINPIIEYPNFKGAPKNPEARGVSVIGGYVYRGKAIPSLSGKYVFADWSRYFVKGEGVLLMASPSTGALWKVEPLTVENRPKPNLSPNALPAYIVALGEDGEGELYVMTNNTSTLTGTSGKVQKIIP